MSEVEMSESELEKYTLPMTMKKVTQRTSKGPIAIMKVEPRGDFIVLENTCVKKPIVLTNWMIKRRGVDVPVSSFVFEKHFVLHPGRVVKIWAQDKGRNNPPHELVAENVKSWGVGTYVYTQLLNHLNQEKATLLEKIEHYERELKQPAQRIPVNFQHDNDDEHSTIASNGFKTSANSFLNKHLMQQGLYDRVINGNDNSYDLVDANYEYIFQRNVSS